MKKIILTLIGFFILSVSMAQNQKARTFPNGIRVLGDPVITAVPLTSHLMVLDANGYSSRILLSDLQAQLGATGSSGTSFVSIIQADYDLLTQQQKDSINYAIVAELPASTPLQASDIAVTPVGQVAATDAQSAIQEIDSEKAPKVSPTFSGDVHLGTSRWLLGNITSADVWEFDATNEETPSWIARLRDNGPSGTILSTYTFNGTGSPVIATDVVPLSYLQANYGSGTGDMLKATYDTNDNGTVDGVDAGSIGSNEILDGSISEADLDIANAPTDTHVLGWNAAGPNFIWIDPATLGGTGDMQKSIYDTNDNGTVDGVDDGSITTAKLNSAFYATNNGTTGVVAKASTGTYTVTSQEWEYVKVGRMVVFKIRLTDVSGTTPTGVFAIDISGTDIPPVDLTSGAPYIFNLDTLNFPLNFYSIQAKPVTGTNINITIQDALDGSFVAIQNVDFAGTEDFTISGSYITN